MAFYCGKDLGDLVVVTLNKSVNDFDASSKTKPTFIKCRRGISSDYSIKKLRVSSVNIL
jgi:hypothetical protein